MKWLGRTKQVLETDKVTLSRDMPVYLENMQSALKKGAIELEDPKARNQIVQFSKNYAVDALSLDNVGNRLKEENGIHVPKSDQLSQEVMETSLDVVSL